MPPLCNHSHGPPCDATDAWAVRPACLRSSAPPTSPFSPSHFVCALFYPGSLRFAINKCCSFGFLLITKEERYGGKMGAGGDRVKSGGGQGSEESGHLLMVFCLKDLIFMCINVWDAYMCVCI